MFFVADFETRTLTQLEEKLYKENKLKLSDLETSVWGWGFAKVGAYKDTQIKIGTTIESFVEHLLSYKSSISVYFHNLKFDGNFILAYMLKNNYNIDVELTREDDTIDTLIGDMGQFYSITVTLGKRKNGTYRTIKFLDSLKKLPFSVDRIAKAFHLEFNKIDVGKEFYERERAKDHELTQEEIEYIRNDIRVISLAVEILRNQDMKSMTVGSDALADYQRRMGGRKNFRRVFPVLEHEVDDDIKKAYRGGVTLAKEDRRNEEIGEGMVFDVNSEYPYVMRYKKMPYGKPLFYEGKYEKYKNYDLYIQEIVCEFKIKKDHLPTIQIKGQPAKYSPTEYLNESNGLTTLHLTNMDLKLFLKHYDVYNLEYTKGYMFKSSDKLFNSYIDYWTSIKETSTGAMRELAKLMLNSLYGKFGTKTLIGSKRPYLNDEGIVKYEMLERKRIQPVYSAIAVFTTSYGRELLLTACQDNYDRFLYCDTDSIHVEGTEKLNGIKIDPNKLGYWDYEGTFKRARFVGAKCYIEDFIDTGLKVTCAGMTKEQHKQVTYENFKEGLIVTGKLQPKTVKGGVVLVSVDYQVKVRGPRF